MVDLLRVLLVFSEFLYLFSTTALAAYGFNSLILAWIFWRKRGILNQAQAESTNSLETASSIHKGSNGYLPKVTVQLPIFNERHVAGRLVESVLALNWPPARLQIQILDDSTDDTTSIITSTLARQYGSEVEVEHLRRTCRTGFKAGALQHGLSTATGEFIVIFDADFLPPTDFLLRAIPHFDNLRVGCVQTRWAHVNPRSSLLTQAQALGIDGHFCVEQNVRNHIGAFLNFNGTAGIWRRRCMDEAGGWHHDTLTEDLDLSYRAQMVGWQIAYQNDIPVPAELPVQVDAFKRQQFRWAKGSLQTALKLLRPLWTTGNQPVWRKILGTIHLTNYMVHPLMVLNLLLLLPISFARSPLLHVAPFLTSAAIGPPIMYWLAMGDRNNSFWEKIRTLAVLMALGTGLSVNNTKAAIEAFGGINSEFKRTPKFSLSSGGGKLNSATSKNWYSSSYALPRHPTVWLELILSIYAGYLLLYCIRNEIWWILIWILMYAIGYAYISGLAFQQSWQIRQARTVEQT